jgi:hypothetical protein
VDRERVQPEDLPPLELRKLRDLEVVRPAGSERAPYVAAASAVARRADFVYVIGDDELDLAVFSASTPGPGELHRALSGELPDDPGERKDEKPDLEALTVLPPFEGASFGALLGLGSGSRRSRDRGFAWRLAADGSLAGDPEEIDLHPLYERLRDEVEELNVEGAAVMGGDLWVFHRGNDAESGNAVIELPLDEVMGSLRGDRSIDVSELRRIRAYELGELGGTRLCFSDAAALTGEMIVFTASAEVEDDSAADGEIRGSVVGTIDAEGGVRRLRAIDRRWKVEGVHAAVDAGVIDLVFVCDQDADEPSPLLSATMPVDAALEPSG